MSNIKSIIGKRKATQILQANLSEFPDGKLPKELFTLVNLRVLKLSGKALMEISPEIGKLTKLKELELYYPGVKRLPKEVGKLVNLEYFFAMMGDLEELPEEIGEWKKLKKLELLDLPMQKLPAAIGKLNALKKIRLRDLLLKTLPAEMGKMAALENLTIDSLKHLETLPDELGNSPKLLNINLYEANSFRRLPSGLGNSKSLQKIFVSKSKLEAIPASFNQIESLASIGIWQSEVKEIPDLSNLKNLIGLRIENSKLEAISKTTYEIPNLRSLDLAKNKIKSLDASIKKLQQLTDLSLRENQLKTVPIEIGKLSNLGHLDLAMNPFPIPPIELSNVWPKPKYFFISDKVLSEDFSPLFNYFRGKEELWKFYPDFFDLITKNEEKATKVAPAVLLKALNSKAGKLPGIAKDYLLNKAGFSLKDRPLQKGSVVTIAGKVSGKKTEWRKKLEEAGLIYNAKITAQTSHVLISPNSKNIENCGDWDWAWISEQQLKTYLDKVNKPYLLVKDKETDEHLKSVAQLLKSKDVSNLALALELLDGGGAPPHLTNELFIRYALSESTEMRRKLRGILRKKASTELLYILKKNWKMRIPSYASYSQWYNLKAKLDKCQECPELEIGAIALAIYEACDGRKRHLYGYALRYSKDQKVRKQVIRGLIDNTILHLHHQSELVEIPQEVVDFKELTSIRFSASWDDRADFISLPEGMEQLENMGYLEIRNYALKEIPDLFLQWPKLHSLFLTLKEQSDWNSLLKLNETGVTRLKINCAFDDEAEPVAIPAQLYKLHKLKELSVLGDKIIQTEDLQKALPNCKVDFVNW